MTQIDETITSYLTALKIEGKTPTTSPVTRIRA